MRHAQIADAFDPRGHEAPLSPSAGVFTGGKQSSARASVDDVAHIFNDGRDGFGDLARRAVARRR